MQDFVTRKQWGARPPKDTTPLPIENIRAFVVHYSAANSDEQALHENCAGRVRGIQNYHMDTQGWNDIAYNWLVCRHGYIFQGRGLAHRSAATGEANGYTVACCFLGDDTKGKADATPKAREAIKDVYRFVKGKTPHKIVARGHRDYMSTSCPGDELYAFVKTLAPE